MKKKSPKKAVKKAVKKPIKKAVKKAPKKTPKKAIKKAVLNKLPPKMIVTKNGLVQAPVIDKNREPNIDKNKYVKVPENAPIETFREVGERVQKKELKWVRYSIENFVGIHYYVILNHT